jgi:hypothetical protein
MINFFSLKFGVEDWRQGAVTIIICMKTNISQFNGTFYQKSICAKNSEFHKIKNLAQADF